MAKRFLITLAAVAAAWLLSAGTTFAQNAQPQPAAPPQKTPFEQMTTGMKKVEGLWTLYYKDQQLLVEISQAHLNQNFIVLTSIAKGISAGQVLGGMT